MVSGLVYPYHSFQFLDVLHIDLKHNTFLLCRLYMYIEMDKVD